MKKLSILIVIISLFAITAMAQPSGQPSPPPGPPPPPPAMEDEWDMPNQMPPPASDRREVWQKFRKEHPHEAHQLMEICRRHPELGCGFGPHTGPGQQPGMRPEMRRGREHEMGPNMGPAMGAAMGAGMGPGMGHGMGMMEQNPAMMEQFRKVEQLREEARSLGMKYQLAQSAEEKKKIEADLRKKLDEVYSLKLEIMRDRVNMVEGRLNMVKSELSNYEKDKGGVIDSWFDQLTGKGRYMKF